MTATSTPRPVRGRSRTEQRYRQAQPIAVLHGGVASRAELRAVGITADDVRSEAAARRWRVHGKQTVALHGGPLTVTAQRWSAIWETGYGAVLDGVTALQVAGLEGFTSREQHVTVCSGQRPHRPVGVRVHSARNVGAGPFPGLPRTWPHVAAIRAAQWAVSDKQAAMLLAMAVQQELVDPQQLMKTWTAIRRSPRRTFIDRVVRDVCDGAQALSELEFAQMCRGRGLPEPTRQSIRQTPTGRAILDAEWTDLRVVVEIDGSYHFRGLAPVNDALRQNAVTIGGRTMLRVPLIGLRLCPEEFLDQIEQQLLTARRHLLTSGEHTPRHSV